jgi:hypothetical protein
MIGFNGCSQVAMCNLNYLDNWQSRSWPALVAKQLQTDYVNVAETLASNQRILRTSIDLVVNCKISDLVVGWTSFDRYETSMYNGDIARLGPDSTHLEHGRNNEDVPNLHKSYYTNYHNEWFCIVSLFEKIILLESLCRAHQTNLYMFNAVQDNCLKNPTKFEHKNYWVANNRKYSNWNKELEYVNNLQQKIFKFNWLMDPDYTLTDLCFDQNLPTDAGIGVKAGHPEINAQSVIADLFVNKIKDYECH